MADCRISSVVDHFRSRIVTPFLHPSSLDILTTSPTARYLLSGAIIKSASTGGEVSLVDACACSAVEVHTDDCVDGTLLSSRLFVPDDLSRLDPKHLKISHQSRFVDDGSHPLPIYSLIRHDVPDASAIAMLGRAIDEAGNDEARADELRKQKDELVARSSWQWYEGTPFEFGCEEIGAFIPTFAFGRPFVNGKSTEMQPELSLTIVAGMHASAFWCVCGRLLPSLTMQRDHDAVHQGGSTAPQGPRSDYHGQD